jgi:hypothetical protein
MRFFDLNHQAEALREFHDRNGPYRAVLRATPRRTNWRCMCFTATAALLGAMLVAGIPVRTHPLYPDRYVVPYEKINEVTLRDLLRDPDFLFLSTTIFVVSGTSQTSPADWDNANNTVEGIGGGGGGASGLGSSNNRAAGGGGGEYRKIANFSVATPGTTNFTYVIGAGGIAVTRTTAGTTAGNNGAQTTFNTSSLIADNGNGGGVAVSSTAAGGVGGSGGTGAADNADGGKGGDASSAGGAGGGGAGGATGAGNPGVDGGPTDGGSGTSSTVTITGGTGGNYGGGGGASASTSSTSVTSTSGAGAQGIIVITYTPVSTGQPYAKRVGGVHFVGMNSGPGRQVFQKVA